jgi:hypothetical protein
MGKACNQQCDQLRYIDACVHTCTASPSRPDAFRRLHSRSGCYAQHASLRTKEKHGGQRPLLTTGQPRRGAFIAPPAPPLRCRRGNRRQSPHTTGRPTTPAPVAMPPAVSLHRLHFLAEASPLAALPLPPRTSALQKASKILEHLQGTEWLQGRAAAPGTSASHVHPHSTTGRGCPV